MNSEIIYLYMYDIGDPVSAAELDGLFRNQEDFSKYEFRRPGPEEIATFDVPHIFNLKDEVLALGETQHRFKVQVAVYTFGSFSIRIRYQVGPGAHSQLAKITFDPKINEFIRELVSKSKKKIESALMKIREVKISPTMETYRFYYIEGEKNQILPKARKMIAGLLVDEKDADTLEDEYIEYILGKGISYDAGSILFVGWESAVMIDKEYQHEQELLIAEISNLQLLEMRIYHAVLARELNTASKSMRRIGVGSASVLRKADTSQINRSLGSVYDNTRAVLNNINDTVFGFGEWYLARVYSLFSSVFKLDTLKASMERDLEAIDNERKFVSDMEVSRHESFLELLVVFLIVVEIVLEILFLAKG